MVCKVNKFSANCSNLFLLFCKRLDRTGRTSCSRIICVTRTKSADRSVAMSSSTANMENAAKEHTNKMTQAADPGTKLKPTGFPSIRFKLILLLILNHQICIL